LSWDGGEISDGTEEQSRREEEKLSETDGMEEGSKRQEWEEQEDRSDRRSGD
jgi:hypothetical protein